MTVDVAQVSGLRIRTGAGVADCKTALVDADGDIEKAVDLLKQRGIFKAESKAGRKTAEGVVGSYVHFNGKVAVLVEVNCETDFVARTPEFQELVRDVAMHIASTNPLGVSKDDMDPSLVIRETKIIVAQVEATGKPLAIQAKMVVGKINKFYQDNALLEQTFVKDDKQTVGDLVKSLSSKTGEAIMVKRFVRWELGQ